MDHWWVTSGQSILQNGWWDAQCRTEVGLSRRCQACQLRCRKWSVKAVNGKLGRQNEVKAARIKWFTSLKWLPVLYLSQAVKSQRLTKRQGVIPTGAQPRSEGATINDLGLMDRTNRYEFVAVCGDAIRWLITRPKDAVDGWWHGVAWKRANAKFRTRIHGRSWHRNFKCNKTVTKSHVSFIIDTQLNINIVKTERWIP